MIMTSQYYDRKGSPLDDDAYRRLKQVPSYFWVRSDWIGDVNVSTTWQGANVYIGSNEPHVFSTMIWGGEHDAEIMTYATEEEAHEGHARAVADLVAGQVPWGGQGRQALVNLLEVNDLWEKEKKGGH